MKIITAGELYTDIDVLACALAYKGLLKLQDLDVEAVLPAPLNLTVTKSIRQQPLDYLKSFKYDPQQCEFIIVDTSSPNHYAKFVALERVVEVFDHHFYDEVDKLKTALGPKAHIEHVGACATLIWEEYKKANMEERISPLNALLLYSAIISNTLDFNANVSTERDKSAAKELRSLQIIPDNWKQQYYAEVEAEILADPIKNMLLDTKKINYSGLTLAITQIELWDSKLFLERNQDLLQDFMQDQAVPLAFITSPCISEGRNYFVALNLETEKILQTIWPDLHFQNGIARGSQLFLRKEILPRLLNL